MNRNKIIIAVGILLLLTIGIIVILKVTKVIKLPIPRDDPIGECCGANAKEQALFAVTGICTGGSGQPGDPYNMYCAPGGFCAGNCCSNDPGEYWSCLQDQTICPPNQYSNYQGDCCRVGQGLDVNAHCCQLGTKGCCVPTNDTIDSQGNCCPIQNMQDKNGICCQTDVSTLDINGNCCGPFQGTNLQGACCNLTDSDCCSAAAWKIYGDDCWFYPECGAYTSANVCCENPGANNCCPLAMGMDVYGNCCNSGVGCCSYDQINQHTCPALAIADLSTLHNKSVNIVLQTDRYTGISLTTITFPNFTELYLSTSPVTYTGKYNATNDTVTFSTTVNGKVYNLAVSGGKDFEDDPYRIANWLQDPSLFNSYQLLGFTIQNNAVAPVSISATDGSIYYGNGNILQDITAQSIYFEFPPLNRPHNTIQSVNLTPSVV